jgi:hypothetical protein
MMIQLTKSLAAWNTPEFEKVLRIEVEQMTVQQLPLQQALSNSSYALDTGLKVVISRVSEDRRFIYVKAGIFYTGIIYGCNCADDPTPVDELPEHCDVEIEINKATSEAKIVLLGEV